MTRDRTTRPWHTRTVRSPRTLVAGVLIFVAVGCAGPEDAELEQVGTGETSETGETGEVLEFGDRYITAQAPTGNLVAVGGSGPACSLVDLDSRSVREIAACDRHDFIPSFGVHAWGSWLYTCNEGTLEVHTPAASVLVDEGVNCNSIEMSRGSPILYCPDGGFSRLFSTVDGSKVFERGPGWFAMSIDRRDAGWHLGDGAQLWTMAPTGGLHIADDVHIIVYAPH